MKFCKYCGKQLEDNEICTCTNAVNEQLNNLNAQNTVNAQQTVPPQGVGQQGTFQQAVPPQGVGQQVVQVKADGKFVKALKEVPSVFSTFWKGSKSIIDSIKAENNTMVAVVFSIIFFLSTLLCNVFIYSSISNSVNSVFGSIAGNFVFKFDRIFFSSILLTVLVEGFSILILFLAKKIFGKEVNSKKAFLDSFIEFSIISIFISSAMLVGGLCNYFATFISSILLLCTVFYLLIQVVIKIKESSIQQNDVFVSLISSIFIILAFVIYIAVLVAMVMWCTGAFDVMHSISSISSIY